MNQNPVGLSEDTKINDDEIRPQQSANALFHCMKKFKYLTDTLRNKALIPRYNEEVIKYLNIPELTRIVFPMTCFCDIYLKKLKLHMFTYGKYGIGIDKDWGITHGIQPIHYINPNSELSKDFSEVFTYSISQLNEDTDESINSEKYSNYLLTNLLFMKPLSGEMYISGEYESKNFHDEKEWRFVPNINNIQDIELPQIITDESIMNPTARNSFSDGIKQCKDLWLNFEYGCIKYLIVKENTERNELIDFIMEEIEMKQNEKYVLISKILVYDELSEDW